MMFKVIKTGLIYIFICVISNGCALLADLSSRYKEAPYIGAIPKRPSYAIGGAKFAEKVRRLSKEQREEAILSEIRRGNIPNRLRQLKAIYIKGKLKNKSKFMAKVWVMVDYLAIGKDDDYFRIPMNPLTAQRIADHFGFLLPTTLIVDEIYKQADIRLKPLPQPPGAHMVSTEYYWKHHLKIQQQLTGKNTMGLVAGHKKDIVITNRLRNKSRRVAIYGWHRPNGLPIQPLSTVHDRLYADYSHGVRLVSGTIKIGNMDLPLAEVLTKPTLAKYFSKEGVINNPRICTECM